MCHRTRVVEACFQHMQTCWGCYTATAVECWKTRSSKGIVSGPWLAQNSCIEDITNLDTATVRIFRCRVASTQDSKREGGLCESVDGRIGRVENFSNMVTESKLRH